MIKSVDNMGNNLQFFITESKKQTVRLEVMFISRSRAVQKRTIHS